MSLIRHSVEAAVGGGCAPVVVVAGRDRERVEEELATSLAQVVHNADWELGIGVSIRTGVSTMIRLDPDITAIVLMVCDQPFVSDATISKLISMCEGNPAGIIASTYEGVQGVPALFGRAYFNELQELPDTAGARRLFRTHSGAVIECPLIHGGLDVDTEEDYQRLISCRRPA